MKRNITVAAAGGAVLLLALAACGSSSGGTSSGGGSSSSDVKVNSSGDGVTGKTGGTLYLPMLADFEHLDPARNYVNTQLDFSRLIYRTLTTYKAVPGKEGLQVVGDLATNTGTPSNGGKTWSFTLKNGLKYENGQTIVAGDIKYGIERSFEPDLPEGNQYIQADLANVPKGYAGPPKSGSLPNSAIDVPNAKTIIFHLNQPVGDFSYLAAEPNFSPVPKSKDTGINYDNRPFSSGPYKIQTYARGKNLTLVRNTYWSRSTDDVRGAYPNEIKCTFGMDPDVVDQQLMTDNGTSQDAAMLDTVVQPQDLAQVLTNSKISARKTEGLTGFTDYIALNTRKIPNLLVRQALEYAIDRQTIRAAAGGTTAGEYASTVSAPNVLGHESLSSLYPAGATGNIAKAESLLKQAKVSKLSLTLGVSDSPAGVRLGTAVQEALQRVPGIKITIDQIPLAKYYDVIGNPNSEPDMMRAGWGADWPSMSTVLPPLFNGNQIRPQGNYNNALLNNKSINKRMAQIEAITDVNKAATQWAALEKTIMEQAPVIPTLYDAGVLLHGSNVHGAYLHAYYGLYDMVSLSVE